MKNRYNLYLLILSLYTLPVAGHGFTADTPVHHFGNAPNHIKHVCKNVVKSPI